MTTAIAVPRQAPLVRAAYDELADELRRLAAAVRTGPLAHPERRAHPRPEPPEEPATPAEPQPEKSVVAMFLESLGGITAYVLTASVVLVLGFNVAIRLFPPLR